MKCSQLDRHVKIAGHHQSKLTLERLKLPQDGRIEMGLVAAYETIHTWTLSYTFPQQKSGIASSFEMVLSLHVQQFAGLASLLWKPAFPSWLDPVTSKASSISLKSPKSTEAAEDVQGL